jgi:hypothetical protein
VEVEITGNALDDETRRSSNGMMADAWMGDL